jgi:hypothetical protein
MKLVKFNTTTTYRHVPDFDYEKIKKDIEELRFKDQKVKVSYLNERPSDFNIIDVTLGDEVEVSDWYYNENKDREIEVSHCIKNYQENNQIQSYNVDDALKHYSDADIKIKKVKFFDLIKDLNTKK